MCRILSSSIVAGAYFRVYFSSLEEEVSQVTVSQLKLKEGARNFSTSRRSSDLLSNLPLIPCGISVRVDSNSFLSVLFQIAMPLLLAQLLNPCAYNSQASLTRVRVQLCCLFCQRVCFFVSYDVLVARYPVDRGYQAFLLKLFCCSNTSELPFLSGVIGSSSQSKYCGLIVCIYPDFQAVFYQINGFLQAQGDTFQLPVIDQLVVSYVDLFLSYQASSFVVGYSDSYTLAFACSRGV